MVRLGVRGPREPRRQVLSDVAAEESGHPVSAVLAHVGELVSEESGCCGGAARDRAFGGRPEEDASPEDDRVRAGERRQDACEATAVKSGAEELVLERREEAVGEGNRKRSARQPKTRRAIGEATRSASAPPCR